MEDAEVEDAMLDGDQVTKCSFVCTILSLENLVWTSHMHAQITTIEDFFSPTGSRCLLFYYEETANSGML